MLNEGEQDHTTDPLILKYETLCILVFTVTYPYDASVLN